MGVAIELRPVKNVDTGAESPVKLVVAGVPCPPSRRSRATHVVVVARVFGARQSRSKRC
jgi:hypothetical protein